MHIYGSIEAGGTKFVCVVSDSSYNIINKITLPTTTPNETMQSVFDFFTPYKEKLVSIGVGSFGPIDIQKNSETYGYITSTPKKYWGNYALLPNLKKQFSIPMAWTTDVNAACYGEYTEGYGKDKNLSSLVYYTVGTGIGGGALQNGHFIEGFSHPEMGHMIIKKDKEDNFEGACPFHGDCLEGLASGPAIEKRTGKKGQNIKSTDTVWDIEAYYLAQCAYNTTLMLSPDAIVFGGGVMKQDGLIEKIRIHFKKLVNGYVQTPPLEQYLVTPKLGDNAATIGCLALAKNIIE